MMIIFHVCRQADESFSRDYLLVECQAVDHAMTFCRRCLGAASPGNAVDVKSVEELYAELVADLG